MRKTSSLFSLALILAFLGTGLNLQAQSTGYYDDFEDGAADTYWKADHPNTFGISEADGNLNIAYTRTAESAAWDNFNFTPPEEIDVSANPVVIFRLRSDVPTVFTVKPIYSNGKSGWIQKNIPDDNAWQTYTYELSESNFQGATLQKIYLYLDGGSTELSSGTVSFDEFQVAGLSVNVTDLQASLVDSVTIRLHWNTSDPAHTQNYNVYRSLSMDFSPAPENLLAQPSDTFLVDTGLEENSTYYYKVSATDTEDREHGPSLVSFRTVTPGSPPTPTITGENTNTVGLHEKYELLIDLADADFDNPYDPDQIDLRAVFEAPDGQTTTIFGFYDDYQGAEQWKIRFAADQAGSWTCQIFATDLDGEGSSEVHSFEVVTSDNPGHVSINPNNPDYLQTSDGNMFYPVAVYYPWWVQENGLDKLAATGCNMFGLWDCTFDGAGNGGGRYLMESMNSGLGKMDQNKAARIDEILNWAEERDLKIMFAMWAHPYLRKDGEHWDGGHWESSNPYSKTFSIEEFFSDSLAMAYQQKHYRYLLARFGYSTSLGTWEIINEMHGTSGWIRSEDMCKTWVEKVHTYFKENDPWQRPTTASFGGSSGASHHYEGDKLGDMPNVHFYEQHGWGNPHPDNLLRSGLANLVTEAGKLKSKGRRPAILGEAGYSSMLTDHLGDDYTYELHNCLWGGLSNGLAATPFWWDYTSTDDILTDERMERYTIFAQFAGDLEFPDLMNQGKVSMAGSDAYFRSGTEVGVGWGYAYGDTAISNAALTLSQSSLSNGTYDLRWFDTWSGGSPGSGQAIVVDGISWTTVPATCENRDIAFHMEGIQEGWGAASQVHLQLVKIDTTLPGFLPTLPGEDSTLYKIVCYVTDEQGMLVADYNASVEILMEGGWEPASGSYVLSEGGIVLDYVRKGSNPATVNASIEGLGSASLEIGAVAVGTAPGSMTGNSGVSLSPVRPNPVSNTCILEYSLERKQEINLAIYDARGSLVEHLQEGSQEAGRYQLTWNAAHLPNGLYFLSLQNGEGRSVQKFVVE